jgi:hypothetical protein
MLLQPVVLAEDAAAADVFAERDDALDRRPSRLFQRLLRGLRVASASAGRLPVSPFTADSIWRVHRTTPLHPCLMDVLVKAAATSGQGAASASASAAVDLGRSRRSSTRVDVTASARTQGQQAAAQCAQQRVGRPGAACTSAVDRGRCRGRPTRGP